MTDPNPWHRLRDLPEIDLLWHDGGPRGLYDFENQTISLRRGMTVAQRRSTLRHELEHHYRGPFLEAVLAHEEKDCEEAAARDLIDIRKLGEVLAYTRDRDTVADELWVDPELVEVRVAHLHPSERAYLKQRLAFLDD